MTHPLFGLFAEPSSTMLLSMHPSCVAEVEEIADRLNFLSARIGTTGGPQLEITVDGESFISAPVQELRTVWGSSLEAHLHGEVVA